MEQHQDVSAVQQPAVHQSAVHQSAVQYWEVTYLDTECGRVRTESFDDAAAAERFASRRVRDEHGWAVVDVVRPREGRAAA